MLEEKTIQEIIERYHENKYLSFAEIADDLKIDYYLLVGKLQPLAKKIELKRFDRSRNNNPHAMNVGLFMIDYYYIVDCNLNTVAKAFGYSSARSALRAMQQNKYYIRKDEIIRLEKFDIPMFPLHIKRMHEQTKKMRNRKSAKNKIEA